jgi:lipopolysaccharide/colanic/teichoic acid biosynthesis glycosyltransferase
MTAKRALDIVVALAALVASSPLLAIAMLAIWAQDGGTPLYRGIRVGRGNRDFRMAKLRSMHLDASSRGGTSTSKSDTRVTAVGRIVRRWKIDELPQFWNVLVGEMSLVGPRPNTRAGGVDRYTPAELHLLDMPPGITDLSSIVFADEGDILDGAADPDAAYDAMIRPWKSRLGLLYVDRRDFATDLRLLWLTTLAIIARPAALRGVDAILARWNADPDLRRVCARSAPLPAARPPEPAT